MEIGEARTWSELEEAIGDLPHEDLKREHARSVRHHSLSEMLSYAHTSQFANADCSCASTLAW